MKINLYYEQRLNLLNSNLFLETELSTEILDVLNESCLSGCDYWQKNYKTLTCLIYVRVSSVKVTQLSPLVPPPVFDSLL